MYSNYKEKTLDVLLQYAQRNQLLTTESKNELLKGCHFAYDKYAVVVGVFAFQVHCHDTGNSVRAYILTDDKPYEIISATFWKQSGYEHNKDKWEKGAWDMALTAAIGMIREAVEEHMFVSHQKEQQRLLNTQVKESAVRSKVEGMFK